jgi:hypothetical protein
MKQDYLKASVTVAQRTRLESKHVHVDVVPPMVSGGASAKGPAERSTDPLAEGFWGARVYTL